MGNLKQLAQELQDSWVRREAQPPLNVMQLAAGRAAMLRPWDFNFNVLIFFLSLGDSFSTAQGRREAGANSRVFFQTSYAAGRIVGILF